jgi:hypothetical protein
LCAAEKAPVWITPRLRLGSPYVLIESELIATSWAKLVDVGRVSVSRLFDVFGVCGSKVPFSVLVIRPVVDEVGAVNANRAVNDWLKASCPTLHVKDEVDPGVTVQAALSVLRTVPLSTASTSVT